MRLISRSSGLGLLLVAVLALCAGGCTQGEGKNVHKAEGAQAKAKKSADESSKHAEWWCDEHGVPEAECSMCSKKVADACKAKGDWCEKHNRAQSQCFICDPALKEVFAAKYRAHYPGKEPPPFDVD
jgi:hypothetical protein